MLASVAITRVKTRTSHDNDGQVSDAQFLEFLQGAQDRLRALLALYAPLLYNTTASFTLTGATVTMAKPADFYSLVRMEKLLGSRYHAVWVSEGLDTTGLRYGLEFREEATNFVVEPIEDAPGDYRMTYIILPTTLAVVGDTIAVPRELDDCIIELVCADVRIRCEEDPSTHMKKFDDMWREVLAFLRRRYGMHPVTGLRRVRGDT